MGMTYYIVGLGNPGEEFEDTRHNTGRIIVGILAKKFGGDKALVKKDTIEFIIPDTFMNRSGKALVTKIKNAKQAERLIVIHDDLDLALGTMKLSFNRGSGGHKGVESIMRAIKTKAFVRVRVGISKATPKGKIKKPSGEEAVGDFILGKFKKEELEVLKKIAKKVGEAIEVLITDGREKAMSIANK